MFEDNLKERYGLAIDRIAEIKENSEIEDAGLAAYFTYTAEFLLLVDKWNEKRKAGGYDKLPLEELQHWNTVLYEDIIGKQYDNSFANPSYACARLGEDIGRILSFLYTELRGCIAFAAEQRKADFTVLLELFVECYCICKGGENIAAQLKDSIYWYMSDYSDDFIEYRVREQLDPSLDFAVRIIMDSDLTDLRYLYRYGEYITENELRTAAFLNTLSQTEIEQMASTFTEGYRIGFELGNKDISKKKLVNIRYCIGFERLVREEIRQFEQMGLKTTIYRAAQHSINKRMHHKIGYYATSPNKQMDYDHRFDNALYLDAQFTERKLGALRFAYEQHKEAAAVFGGPAVMEVFGENPFEPEDKKEALHLDEKQQKLSVKYDSESSAVVNKYIKGEERSFTIIAYPLPEISENADEYEKIFHEIVRINTLDYNQYKEIQQTIIDALDSAEYVHVKGCGNNQTDMRVSLQKITNPQKETVFENCLADVNIPVGEVFTSPKLKGTNGLLHVTEVYLNGLCYKDLKITFKDGMVDDYECANFPDKEDGRKFIKENLLYNRETLPMGECAIGTNTTAYVMAAKYGIMEKLPILIAEKMGPHIAIGDTCYSYCEDVRVYNPDGKEIVAKENECSAFRKEDPKKAYFNCHTDITIPYEELSRIAAVTAQTVEVPIMNDVAEERVEIPILLDGRFVLEGTLKLNEPFEGK